MTGRIRNYTAIYLIVFILILVIGILSEVSLKASVIRAFTAATLFTVLCLVLVLAASGCGTTDHAEKQVRTGGNLDIRVADPIDEFVGSTQTPDLQNNTEAGFIPLNAKQIDPKVSKIISSDPDKMAEIVRKMGFE